MFRRFKPRTKPALTSFLGGGCFLQPKVNWEVAPFETVSGVSKEEIENSTKQLLYSMSHGSDDLGKVDLLCPNLVRRVKSPGNSGSLLLGRWYIHVLGLGLVLMGLACWCRAHKEGNSQIIPQRTAE